MKKIWVLEKFITTDMMKATMNKLMQDKDNAISENDRLASMKILDVYTDFVEKNPDGCWLAHRGKCNYTDFCQVAREDMRKMLNQKKKVQWRVIEGQIEDDSTTWSNYEVVKVNERVFKYLWATMLHGA